MSTENHRRELQPNPSSFARLSRLIVDGRPIDEVLQAVLEEAAASCGADRGFLAIVDHDRGELDVRYTVGMGWSEEKRRERLKVSRETGRGITSRVAATREPYLSPNVLEDPYYIMSFEDVRSEIAVPVLDNLRRTRGVLNLESLRHNAFDDSYIEVLSGLSDLAAVAMTISDHRSRQAALAQIGKELGDFTDKDMIAQKVIDVAAEVLKFEDCSLFLLDRPSGKLVLAASRGQLSSKKGQAAYEFGEGLTGWTAEQQQPVRLVDPRSDPRWRGRFEELPVEDVSAFMAVPIHNRSGMIGVLRVQRRKSPYEWFPNDFTEDDELILATIGGQLGIALDNLRLLDQVRKSERLAAWGEMSARSAHMIGNRVFAIKGDINELEHLMGNPACRPEETLKLLGSIKKGIFLLEEILNEFREFVKATQLQLEEVDLNQLVREAVEEGFPKRSQTQLKLRLAPNLPTICADPKKLKRCFGELMENSVNFQPDGGRITVTTGFADDVGRKWLPTDRQSESFVQVCFEDTGPGIKRENKPIIFNPFYTSRAKGMGLGLSIVKGIVEAHRGIIFESGKHGKGAKFTILLPYEQDSAEPGGEDEPNAGERSGPD